MMQQRTEVHNLPMEDCLCTLIQITGQQSCPVIPLAAFRAKKAMDYLLI